MTLTLTQWQRRKRQEAEQDTLDQYPPSECMKVLIEGWGLRDKLERALA